MTTVEPRWTKETEALLVKVQTDLRAEFGDEWNFYEGARRMLAALADANLLVQHKGEYLCAHWPIDGKCQHCHDDPPPGHTCPACGMVASS